MPVESPVNYITDLVKTNPLHTDGLGASDSHHRLIKTAVQQSFPNINAPVTATPAQLNAIGVGYVPVGGIIMWSGTIAAIPANWHLCDGTTGTPDLRDRFIIGADHDTGGTYNVGQTGGAASAAGLSTNSDGATVTDSQGAHSHTGATAAHTLVVAEIPSHTHQYNFTSSTVSVNAGGGNGVMAISTVSTATDVGTGGNGGHSHNISTDGAHTHNAPAHVHAMATVPTIPPYYALAFIMRTS